MPKAKTVKMKLTALEQLIHDLKATLPAQQDWRSSDEQEIARRQIRALENPPAIRNLSPKERIFSNFEVISPESGLVYFVEIRDLLPTTDSALASIPRLSSITFGSAFPDSLKKLSKAGAIVVILLSIIPRTPSVFYASKTSTSHGPSV